MFITDKRTKHVAMTITRSQDPTASRFFLFIYFFYCSPFPERQIIDYSKLKEFVGDNFKFDENGRDLSKGDKNTFGKGKIDCYEQFLLFPQCFQMSCTADM